MPAWLTSYPARTIRRLREFDWEQRRIALASVVALPVLHVAARFGGLRAVRRLLPVGSSSAKTSRSRDGFAVGRHLATPVATTASALHLDGSSCVARSTFLWWLLRRRGVAADVVIGSRRLDGRFEAHAWVEVDGAVVDDAPDVRERFAAFDGAGSVMGRS